MIKMLHYEGNFEEVHEKAEAELNALIAKHRRVRIIESHLIKFTNSPVSIDVCGYSIIVGIRDDRDRQYEYEASYDEVYDEEECDYEGSADSVEMEL